MFLTKKNIIAYNVHLIFWSSVLSDFTRSFFFIMRKNRSTSYRTSHSKMCTEGVLKTIGIKHFNNRTSEAIIGWQKERWSSVSFQRSWVLSLSRVWIQISQKFISAMVGVVCSWFGGEPAQKFLFGFWEFKIKIQKRTQIWNAATAATQNFETENRRLFCFKFCFLFCFKL